MSIACVAGVGIRRAMAEQLNRDRAMEDRTMEDQAMEELSRPLIIAPRHDLTAPLLAASTVVDRATEEAVSPSRTHAVHLGKSSAGNCRDTVTYLSGLAR